MSPARLAYAGAIGLVEGGWIAVLYLLTDALAEVRPPLGFGVFAVVAAMTCLFVDRIDRLAGTRIVVIVGLLMFGALAGLGLAAVVVVLGSDPAVRSASTGIGPMGDPGAVLLGLAALRGFLRAGALRDQGEASRPFFLGLLGLSAMWILAGALAEPGRLAFREAAIIPTVGFIAGGIVAAGLARSDLAAAGAGYDPHTNRVWSVALVGVAVVLALASVPLGSAAERAMAAIIARPLTVPVLVIVAIVARLIVPSRQAILRSASDHALGLVTVLGILVLDALLLPPPPPSLGGPVGVAGTGTSGETNASVVGIVLAVGAIALLAVALLYLANAWRTHGRPKERLVGGDLRTYAADPTDVDGERRLGLGGRLRALTRRGRPTDAVTAYLAALRELAGHRELDRSPAETPAAHARRLHQIGAGTLELDLLAADFELARWGGRSISRAEDRRAIGRWERLRRRLAEARRQG